MIAKATAKASGCKFINLQASTLTDMWYGESQKLTAAVFSLADKIQPCIIFIDEIGEVVVGSDDLLEINVSNSPSVYTEHGSCVFRVLPEEPLQSGPRGHSHDEGPVHESVGRPGHVRNYPGSTTATSFI